MRDGAISSFRGDRPGALGLNSPADSSAQMTRAIWILLSVRPHEFPGRERDLCGNVLTVWRFVWMSAWKRHVAASRSKSMPVSHRTEYCCATPMALNLASIRGASIPGADNERSVRLSRTGLADSRNVASLAG